MRVFGSVGVSVGVVVLDMFVLVAGMRVRVSSSVVIMIMRVGFIVTVLALRHCRLLSCELPDASIVLSAIRPGNRPFPVD
jgi:hypothetical protein